MVRWKVQISGSLKRELRTKFEVNLTHVHRKTMHDVIEFDFTIFLFSLAFTDWVTLNVGGQIFTTTRYVNFVFKTKTNVK